MMVIYTDRCIYNHGTHMGLYDYVTTKHFQAITFYFKAYKKPELAFQIVVSIWQTIVHFKQ